MSIITVPANADLQAVFDTAPENSVIVLPEGTFRGKYCIQTHGLTVIGAGSEKTKLVFGDYARKRHPIGYEYNTFRTYTLAVCADHVTMRGLCIENDARFPETKGQEIALSVLGDEFLMEECVLRSTQDTLFCGPLPSDLIGRYEGFLADPLRRGGRLRQTYRKCLIEGTVDFIFGCGEALFDACELRSLCDARGCGYVAAPSHALRQTEGFTFRDCNFTAEAGVARGSIYLARPWRDYGKCRYEACIYGAHIAPEGFDKWSGTHRDETARFSESPAVSGRAEWVGRI